MQKSENSMHIMCLRKLQLIVDTSKKIWKYNIKLHHIRVKDSQRPKN